MSVRVFCSWIMESLDLTGALGKFQFSVLDLTMSVFITFRIRNGKFGMEIFRKRLASIISVSSEGVAIEQEANRLAPNIFALLLLENIF